jgi:hypothetical protein
VFSTKTGGTHATKSRAGTRGRRMARDRRPCPPPRRRQRGVDFLRRAAGGPPPATPPPGAGLQVRLPRPGPARRQLCQEQTGTAPARRGTIRIRPRSGMLARAMPVRAAHSPFALHRARRKHLFGRRPQAVARAVVTVGCHQRPEARGEFRRSDRPAGGRPRRASGLAVPLHLLPVGQRGRQLPPWDGRSTMTAQATNPLELGPRLGDTDDNMPPRVGCRYPHARSLARLL